MYRWGGVLAPFRRTPSPAPTPAANIESPVPSQHSAQSVVSASSPGAGSSPFAPASGVRSHHEPLLDSPVAAPPSPQEALEPLADGVRRARSRSTTPEAPEAAPQWCAAPFLHPDFMPQRTGAANMSLHNSDIPNSYSEVIHKS